jgi:FixJ family two-component response regulator
MNADTLTESLGHVFLVDDDDGLRESIAGLLRSVGYKVQSWQSATDFLEAFPRVVPAVLVTDMRMPGMSGVELHAELIRLGRTVPVVYISGESTVPHSIFWSSPLVVKSCYARSRDLWKKIGDR